MGRVFSDLAANQSERETVGGEEYGTVKGRVIHFGRTASLVVLYLFCMEWVRASYDGEMRRGGIIEELEVEMLQGKSIVMCHEIDEALV